VQAEGGSGAPLTRYAPFPLDGHVVRWQTWEGDAEETLDVRWENEGWTASGVVGRERVQYVVRLSATWQMRHFLLFRDLDEPDLWLATDGSARWGEMNGAHRVELDGCYDVALSCTPFTTTLPIRRLPLHVGDTADLVVAHVDVDTLEVRPVRRRYTRLGERRWAVSDLDDHGPGERPLEVEVEVDQYGLVVDEPGRFRRVA
jgi:hypothetical protein